jgi:ABC-type transporter lipoprotein component MlaA
MHISCYQKQRRSVFDMTFAHYGVNSGYILKVVTSMISREDACNLVENFDLA